MGCACPGVSKKSPNMLKGKVVLTVRWLFSALLSEISPSKHRTLIDHCMVLVTLLTFFMI